ncbi:uncharacterized protein LOC122384399 [Amphibalanus amphitrite]|uniref:uncharacterized protein LOC122384399 n=1 Tax=Amphibalanus amphitrite TaxID=1232801 RepID=UPI001C908499|nr:uncharacterized protein LOC122384399 [Amphibalanus amphitrite]
MTSPAQPPTRRRAAATCQLRGHLQSELHNRVRTPSCSLLRLSASVWSTSFLRYSTGRSSRSQRCSERGISLNKEKFVYGQRQIRFAGYEVSEDGYKIDTSLTRAIAEFPTPGNVTDLRSFAGLVNQVASFSPRVAELMTLLRPLMSTCNEFLWQHSHQEAFEKRLRFKASEYNFTASWRRSEEHQAADALSRSPVDQAVDGRT